MLFGSVVGSARKRTGGGTARMRRSDRAGWTAGGPAPVGPDGEGMQVEGMRVEGMRLEGMVVEGMRRMEVGMRGAGAGSEFGSEFGLPAASLRAFFPGVSPDHEFHRSPVRPKPNRPGPKPDPLHPDPNRQPGRAR